MRSAAAVAFALVAATLAGCGSSGNSGSTSTRASGLSHAELVRRADAICERAHTAQQQRPRPKTLRAAAGALDAGLVIATKELADLRALEPSPEDRVAYAAVLRGFARSIAATRRARAQLRAGDRAKAQLSIEVALRAVSQTEATATGFGLTTCAQPSDASTS